MLLPTESLPCKIRPARPSDVPTIRVMKERLARAEGSLHAINASEADWRRDLFGHAPRFAVFLAELGDTVAGMIILSERFFPGWTQPTLHVNDLFVAPESRRRGIGRALLAWAAQEALRRQASFIDLEVRRNNSARSLYRKVGFARVRDCAPHVLTGVALVRLAESIATLIG